MDNLITSNQFFGKGPIIFNGETIGYSDGKGTIKWENKPSYKPGKSNISVNVALNIQHK